MNNTFHPPMNIKTIIVLTCLLLVSGACSHRSLHTTSHAQKAGQNGSDSSELSPFSTNGEFDNSALGDGNAANRGYESGENDLGYPEADGNTFQNEELVSDEESAVKELSHVNSGQQHWENRRRAELFSAEAGLHDIFFEFDSWRLTKQAKRILASNAEWLNKHPESQLTIEGHCDERGTHAYNYALSEKRATMARNYLAALGISPARLGIVSYGKDNPSCTDLTDTCFERNRRAHLLVGVHVASTLR